MIRSTLLPLLTLGTLGTLRMLAPVPADAQNAPGLADAVRTVVRLEPAAFPQLPRAIQRALVARRCTVPQTPWFRRPHNVVRGRFTGPGRNDWAVLCAPEGHDWAHILIFHRGSAERIDSLAASPLATYLMPLGPNRRVYERVLSRATPATIREIAEPHRDPLPRCLDHDGLKDSFSDKSAVIWYRLDGLWGELGLGGTVREKRWTTFAEPCGRTSG